MNTTKRSQNKSQNKPAKKSKKAQTSAHAPKPKNDSTGWDGLHAAAREAYRHSYAPYSSFPVGAAVQDENGRIYGGCNVENANYGGICAERVAICKAVSEGATKIARVVVITPQKNLVPPCGFCLQFIAELGTGGTEIGLGDLKSVQTVRTLDDHLPIRFELDVPSKKG